MAILKYSVKFILRHGKGIDSSIRCVVRFNNQSLFIGTNLTINRKFWNSKTQEPKSTNLFDGSSISEKLNEIKEFVKSEFNNLDSYPSADVIKRSLFNFIGSGVDAPEKDAVTDESIYFIAYFDDLIKRMDSGAKRIVGGKAAGQKYAESTVKSYESALGVFRGMADFQNKRDYLFDDVDKNFYDDLQSYFYNERKQSSGYFATTVKILQSVMSEAENENLHSSLDFKSRHFVKPSYESDTIYLTMDQLKVISDVELDQAYLRKARDIFLVGCWTGLRFSDFSELTIDDIDGDYIRVLTEKTKARVTIPCHPIIKEVLDRNGGNFPSKISSQKLNKYIKDVGAEAELDNIVSFKRSVGGVDVYEDVEFHKLISTHTARRSFATNMFKMGIPTFVIMAITGHKTEGAFFKYIRVSNEEKAQMMREMWKKLGIFK